MTRPLTYPIGLMVEAAMASVAIKVKLVCPLITPSFPPGMQDYDPKRHNLIEGVSKCLITRQEAQAKFNEYHEAQGSHDEVYTDGSKMNERVGGSGSHQPPFPGWRNNLPPPVQKTARQQHHLCCWGYSHLPGTEHYHYMGPVHHNVVVYSDSMSCLQAIEGEWEASYLPYHEPPLVIEWQGHTCSFLLDTEPLWHRGKWKSRPADKRDPWPWHRPTCKCPPCRFEANGQLLYPAAGSNQVGCGCTQ